MLSAVAILEPLEGEADDVDAVFESDEDNNYESVDYGTRFVFPILTGRKPPFG